MDSLMRVNRYVYVSARGRKVFGPQHQTIAINAQQLFDDLLYGLDRLQQRKLLELARNYLQDQIDERLRELGVVIPQTEKPPVVKLNPNWSGSAEGNP